MQVQNKKNYRLSVYFCKSYTPEYLYATDGHQFGIRRPHSSSPRKWEAKYKQ
jgi:hypothetical protein